MELKRDVSLTAWRAPARQEAVYASGSTPLGPVILTRRPGDRAADVESAAEAREDWDLSLQGERRLRVHGLAAPGLLSRKLLRRGITASLDKAACRVTVSSAYSRPKRSVCFRGPAVDLTFTTRGLGIDLLERGGAQAVRKAGAWQFAAPTAAAVLAVCLFEWAEMDYFLRTPGLRLL